VRRKLEVSSSSVPENTQKQNEGQEGNGIYSSSTFDT
jgi:hypothetical protein